MPRYKLRIARTIHLKGSIFVEAKTPMLAVLNFEKATDHYRKAHKDVLDCQLKEVSRYDHRMIGITEVKKKKEKVVRKK
jgi:hypothetical protein